MTVIIGVAVGMLIVAAALVLWRMVAGPTPWTGSSPLT